MAFDQGQYLTALKLAEAAAAKDDPQAHTLIGRIHAEGLGVPRDPVAAAKWYHRATELGDIEAAFSLGVMFAEGTAIKRDWKAAADLFERAALKGHAYANYNLALLFLSGNGKPENPIRGAQHMTYAAEKGIAAAQYDLATLLRQRPRREARRLRGIALVAAGGGAGMAEAEYDYAVMLLRGQGLNVDRPRRSTICDRPPRRASRARRTGWHSRCSKASAARRIPRKPASGGCSQRRPGSPTTSSTSRWRGCRAPTGKSAEQQANEWRERSAVGALPQ